MENNQTAPEKFEVVKSEPYRFVGGCVYVGNKGYYMGGKGVRAERNILSECIWNQSDWVFKMLDELKEYATDEIHNASLATWEKYDEKNQLFGYYIGRFMKANTPVPPDLDYFDINAEYIAKAWWKGKRGEGFGKFWGGGVGIIIDELNKTGLYNARSDWWEAQAFPEPGENGESFVGAYCPCELKKPERRFGFFRKINE